MPNPTFVAEYPGAIVYPAHPDNYYRPERHGGIPNVPRALFLHAPQEPADADEVTPRYFSNRIYDKNGNQILASTHYYASGGVGTFGDGAIYQMVPERCMAVANGQNGMPLPSWANPRTSLNWQSLSIEIEGYSATLKDTCPRGSAQWMAVVRWVENRSRIHRIPLDRVHVMGHYEVAIDRTDPGTLDIDAIVRDAQAIRNKEDIVTIVGQFAEKIPWVTSYIVFVTPDGARKRPVNGDKEYQSLLAAGYPVRVKTKAELAAIIDG